jgi:hypothetical protein
MKIYFGGSISGGRGDAALYLQIIELLRGYGTVLTEHIGDAALSNLGEGPDRKTIHDRDLTWLREADVIVAEVTTPSLGVGYELGRAVEWNKKILCLYRPDQGRSLSAMIAGCDNVKVAEYKVASDLSKIFNEFFP